LLYRQTSGVNEAEQQVRSTPKPGKTTIDELADRQAIGRFPPNRMGERQIGLAPVTGTLPIF
jgi:hypothetical protein